MFSLQSRTFLVDSFRTRTDPVPPPLDPAQAESIKSAMKGIALPAGAVPAWAKDMSEQEWEDMVKRKLLQKKEKK